MRRIALVCDWYHPRRGGIEAHLAGLARHLTTRGHDVQVITSTPGPSDVDGIRVHRLAIPLIPGIGVVATPPAPTVQQVLVSERIDVVHSHVSIVSPVAFGGALAAHRAHLPSVVTFHSFVPATPLLAGITGKILGAHQWQAQMTAVSRRVVREVRGFAPSRTFAVLPNAVDTDFWTPGEDRVSREVRIAYVGRLHSKKRPLLLLRVLRDLAQIDHVWRLSIIGSGPLEGRLRAGVRALGLEDRVTFTGWTSASDLRDILRSTDVFLSTAARESFGLAALEARAVGVPVVAVKDSAVAEFISHGESGMLLEGDDAFVAAVRKLVTDDHLRRRIAEFNRSTAVPLSWDHTLSLHERTYDAALAATR
jgi:glycosyltransferase involved in cell wall biosynthesis